MVLLRYVGLFALLPSLCYESCKACTDHHDACTGAYGVTRHIQIGALVITVCRVALWAT